MLSFNVVIFRNYFCKVVRLFHVNKVEISNTIFRKAVGTVDSSKVQEYHPNLIPILRNRTTPISDIGEL